MIYIIYFLLAYGISNILVYANGPFHIFKYYRENVGKIHPHLEEMAHCMICTPTWVGFILSAINIFLVKTPFTPFNIILGHTYIECVQEALMLIFLIIFLDGCITSGVVWLIHTIQESLERVNNNEEEIIDE